MLSKGSRGNVAVLSASEMFGDALFFTPIVKSLKEKFPDVKIYVLATKKNYSVFENNPYIEEVIYSRSDSVANGGSFIIRCYKCFFYLRTLLSRRAWKPQIYIGVRGARYETLLSYLLSANSRINFEGHIFRRNKQRENILQQLNNSNLTRFMTPMSLLTNTVPLSEPSYYYHEIEKIAQALDLRITPEFEVYASDAEIAKARNFYFEGACSGRGQKTILFAPMGGKNIRNLPLQLASSVIFFLKKQEKNLRILIVGPEKNIYFRSLMSMVPEDEKIRYLVGTQSFRELFELAKLCDGIVTTDSSMSHVAFGLKKPATIIFGPGDIKIWSPPNENIHVVTKNLPCSPCWDQCIFKENFCLTELSSDSVTNEINKMLQTL
jgi:ADP-heptose:LPS heptosyltransferase